jgi:hypothetical protein
MLDPDDIFKASTRRLQEVVRRFDELYRFIGKQLRGSREPMQLF